MIITRTSAYSGKEHRRNIALDPNDWVLYQKGYGNINEMMPYLTDTDREFILSGMIPQEWKEACAEINNIVEDTIA
jgi:hypothetical protein